MEGFITKKCGVISFLSEDGFFGSIIGEDNIQYDFHKSYLKDELGVGDSVNFTAFYDSQLLKYLAVSISRKELVKTLSK